MKKLFAAVTAVVFSLSAVAGEYPDISIKDLRTAIEAKKVTVIDVNGTRSWEKGHIPGAINFESAKDKLAALLPKDKDSLVVAYCGGPACQAYQQAAKAAKALGYKNVKHLSAGISGWKQAGQSTETPKKASDAS